MLPCDICQYICRFLSDRDKCRFIRCNKILSQKCQPLFTDIINIKKIIGLEQYDRFANVDIGLSDDTNIRFPNNLRNLHVYSELNFKIPSSVTHLELVNVENIRVNQIPTSVISLRLGAHFNKPIVKNKIPSYVKYLKFGLLFNQPIGDAFRNYIPSLVTHLSFGWFFNQLIENHIPTSVTHLVFGDSFNQSIYNSIPNSVIELTFGSKFNQPIDDCIPSSVKYLTFGTYFNQPIVLTHHMKVLQLGRDYDQPISHLMDYVDEIRVSRKYNWVKHFAMEKIKLL